jgi:Glycosyltransferase family 87
VIARSESWFLRASGQRVAAAAALGAVLFSLAWVLLHVGFYDDSAIVDTPVYRGYGDAVLEGQVPYRDFDLEYPPGALPVFVLPSLAGTEDYDAIFQAVMFVCGAAAVVSVAVALAALGASTARLYAGVAFTALTPLALGQVVLTRYDLWPAALTAGALAGLVSGRERLGGGLLGAAVAAKLYPLVLVPLALVYVWKRRGVREALLVLGLFAAVVGLAFLPFAVVAPDGLLGSFEQQTGRPLQIESLGAGMLLAADRLGLYEASVVSSYGSQNLTGSLPDALASVQVGLELVAVAAVWLAFARSRGRREQLVAAAAAAVAVVVAFGKVLSPQFLIWLLPLVPLVAGSAGLAASGLLVGALVLTQLWFPARYWDVVALRPVAWLVVLRDFVLVGLAVSLAVAIRRERARARTG